MTVKELISILEKLPETWLVGTGDFDDNDVFIGRRIDVSDYKHFTELDDVYEHDIYIY